MSRPEARRPATARDLVLEARGELAELLDTIRRHRAGDALDAPTALLSIESSAVEALRLLIDAEIEIRDATKGG